MVGIAKILAATEIVLFYCTLKVCVPSTDSQLAFNQFKWRPTFHITRNYFALCAISR